MPQDPPWFLADDLPAQGPITLGAGESAHLARVLRLESGTPITLFDGRGRTQPAKVVTASPKAAVCEATEPAAEHPRRPPIVIAAASPKGPRADAMVDMLAQLGATAWVPLRSERSVVHPRDAKLDRWRAAAVQTCKQCHDPWAMGVGALTSLAALFDPAWSGASARTALGLPDADLAWRRLWADTPAGEDGRGGVPPWKGPASPLLVLVGPEGGWTDAERAAAGQAGCQTLSLGANVLRVETAAVAAAAVLRSGEAR